MESDGKNTKTDTPANIKKLKQIRQILWAILGLKMAIDRLKELKFDISVFASDSNHANITLNFGTLNFDFDAGTLNGKDVLRVIDELTKKIKTGGEDEER